MSPRAEPLSPNLGGRMQHHPGMHYPQAHSIAEADRRRYCRQHVGRRASHHGQSPRNVGEKHLGMHPLITESSCKPYRSPLPVTTLHAFCTSSWIVPGFCTSSWTASPIFLKTRVAFSFLAFLANHGHSCSGLCVHCHSCAFFVCPEGSKVLLSAISKHRKMISTSRNNENTTACIRPEVPSTHMSMPIPQYKQPKIVLNTGPPIVAGLAMKNLMPSLFDKGST
mmetsp:Transcript_55169/g.159763  ORF Transcript_55169/g.159763 Transcript_55169/m.159763 type:complete len:224 (+) Transcript_55169:100-771(+)